MNAGSMRTWGELAAEAPELAGPGRELLERFQFVLIGTLSRDGSPRVNPVEAYVVDEHLVANMFSRSLKALDLLRDARVYVHAPVTAKSGDPELKLAGRSIVLEDPELRRELDDVFWRLIEWRPAPDSHYFEFVFDRGAYVTYDGNGQLALRWRAGEGVRRTYRAGI